MFRKLTSWFWAPAQPAAIAHRPPKLQLAEDGDDTADSTSDIVSRDALGLLQTQLSDATVQFKKELDAWSKVEIEILAGRVQNDDEIPGQRRLSFWQQIKEELKRIKEAAESAEDYLYELLDAANTHIRPVQIELRKLLSLSTDDFKKLDEIQQQQYLVHVCNKSIAILHGLELLINNFTSEIKYCLDFEQLKEKIYDKGLEYVSKEFLQINLPTVDQNQEFSQYRLKLYSTISMPAGDIAAFLLIAKADLELAAKYVNEKKVLVTVNAQRSVDPTSNLFKPALNKSGEVVIDIKQVAELK